ncbi:unnamed protein product [Prorocentrum cordatum]|uniref:Sugar phosphate transporter domain-containing protein n=1 Tax=Prorocentrum cordatum TaxID=2364126 RepID=A0ABN9T3B7_9DINO|nr:unnamed protein product [Polarella glacialis]
MAASNVEAVIVFRALSPLCVSVLDWMLLDRELLSMRSWLVLFCLVVGAIGYVSADSEFGVVGISAYKWVCLNPAGIVFEMTYGKKLISGVQFKSPVWGATSYTNALVLLPMPATAISSGEVDRATSTEMDLVSACWLVASCIIGLGISWSGWNCRSKLSATADTLLGVVCKLASVLLNVSIWNTHASPRVLFFLLVCLAWNAAYKQAPLRKEASATRPVEAGEEEVIGCGCEVACGARDTMMREQKSDTAPGFAPRPWGLGSTALSMRATPPPAGAGRGVPHGPGR